VKIEQALRIRRHQPTRLEGFVDASFAVAVTLLVISIGRVPGSVPEMLHALRGVPAFALCFLTIARIWKTHREWSRSYDLEDEVSMRLSLALVFVVLVFVYPLRFLFASMFAGLSGGWLVDEPLVLHSLDELRAAFEVYGCGFAAISALFALLYRHALRETAAIGLDANEIVATRLKIAIWLAMGALSLVSVLLAALLPFRADQPLLYTLPGTIYALAGIATGTLRRRFGRQLAQPA
jgi:uncharacterized membrane protein